MVAAAGRAGFVLIAALAAGERADGLAAAADGTSVLLAWVRDEAPLYLDGTVFAALASAPRYAFGAPVAVSPGEHASAPLAVRGAGTWTIAWTSRSEGGPGASVRVAAGGP